MSVVYGNQIDQAFAGLGDSSAKEIVRKLHKNVYDDKAINILSGRPNKLGKWGRLTYYPTVRYTLAIPKFNTKLLTSSQLKKLFECCNGKIMHQLRARHSQDESFQAKRSRDGPINESANESADEPNNESADESDAGQTSYRYGYKLDGFVVDSEDEPEDEP